MIKGKYLLLVLLLSPTAGLAAEERLLEEVVVTAQKREQSANDIGVSVNAFSEENLEALGIQEATDVLNFTPGATLTSSGQGIPIYTIRGIGFDDYNTNSSSTVGINMDEVAIPYPVMTRIPLYDLERVEVLKGPQGTLYGQNTTGGTVNFITNKADFADSARIRLGYDNNDRIMLQGFLNGGLTDTFGARLSFMTEQGGAWQKNAAVEDLGSTHGDSDVGAVRLNLSWLPADTLEVQFKLDYYKDEGDNVVPQHDAIYFINPDIDLVIDPGVTSYIADEIRAGGLPDTSDPNAASWNPDGNTFGGDHPRGTFDRNNQGLLATLRFDWDLEHFTVTSITSINDYERDEANAWDGVATANWDSYNNSEIDVWSQELRLTSSGAGPFSWIAGIYAAGDEVNEISTGSGVISSPQLYITPEGLGVDVNGDGVVDLLDVQAVGLNFDTFSTRYKQKTETIGVFAHTEYAISDSLSLNVGARYTDDTREIIDSCTYDVDGLLANFFSSVVFEGTRLYEQGDCVTLNPETFESEPYNEKFSSDNLSGKIGLDWRPVEDVLVYGNVSTGYKMGGFGAPAAASWDSLASYDQEEVVSYELGVKSTLASGALQLNAAAFRYDYDDKQVSAFVIDPVFGSLTKIINAPKSVVQGLELEASWYVTDMTLVQYSGSFLDSEYKEFESYLFGQSLAENPDPVDLSGTRIQNTPEYQHNLMVHHEFNISEAMYGFVGGDWAYSSGFNSLVGDNPAFDVDSFSVVKLRLGIGSQADTWRLTGWVDNLLDENYFTAMSPSNDSNVRIMGRERRFGVTFEYFWQ